MTQSQNPAPPVPQGEEEGEDNYTVGEFEEMDLTPLYDKTFLVAINTGPMDKGKFICETICGPFDFYEMVENVGCIYESEQLHAKAIIPGSSFGSKPQVLNANTIDYIEARYMDIIADGLLDGGVLQAKKYTCTAGFIKDEVKEEQESET